MPPGSFFCKILLSLLYADPLPAVAFVGKSVDFPDRLAVYEAAELHPEIQPVPPVELRMELPEALGGALHLVQGERIRREIQGQFREGSRSSVPRPGASGPL